MAQSRHPRVTDYTPAAHAYLDSYLEPSGYTIYAEDFPGMLLTTPAGDQRSRPGAREDHPKNLYKLSVPVAITGWRYTVTGRTDAAPTIGPRRDNFHSTVTIPLPSVMGSFDPEEGAWTARLRVPGPGVYTVTVDRMVGTNVAKTFTSKLRLKDFLVVSIGDSAASGQGNPDIPGEAAGFDPDLSWYDLFIPGAVVYKLSREALKYSRDRVLQASPTIARAGGFTIETDPQPVWLEPRAQRSLRGSHAFSAKLCEDLRAGTMVTFLGYGRTGADIDDGLIGPRTSDGRSIDDWANHRGQVAEVAAVLGTRRIDALIVNIGVNDIGVSGTLTSLVQGDAPVLGTGDPTKARRDAEALARQRLADLPAGFDRLEQQLATLNVGKVFLVEYPTALFDDANGNPKAGCELFDGPHLNLSLRDAELIKHLAHDLNQVLATVAQAKGWIFVTGVESAFQTHGYCRPLDERWFRTATESLALQGDTEGTIHPDQKGQKAIGELIAARVKRYTITPGLAPDGNVGRTPGQSAPAAGAPAVGTAPAASRRRRPAAPAAAALGGA